MLKRGKKSRRRGTSPAAGPDVATTMRTLFVAGYSISEANTAANQLEVRCERKDVFGNPVRYIFAVTSLREPPRTEITALRTIARDENRILIAVASSQGEAFVSWDEFLTALGGAVPSWRALDESYARILRTSSRNENVPGFREQAWSVFESAVADGLEFAFGIRVRRLGGIRRGLRVSDIIAQTPDDRVLVVDAKASKKPYAIPTDAQRALAEYVSDAKVHQKGANSVGSAVIVARDFAQSDSRLVEIANDFLAETQVPMSFVTVAGLLQIIEFCRRNTQLRPAVRWSHIFCQSGVVTKKRIQNEFSLLVSKRVNR